MADKYKDVLVNQVSKLDTLTDSKGEITQFALEIINKKDKIATIELCKTISKVIKSGDRRIIRTASMVKDSLIQFYGYDRVKELCNPDEHHSNSYIKELSLDELLLELNRLVGLRVVKSKVYDLIAYQKIQQLRKSKGLCITKNTLHLAFTGNPGTGKTTVARIVGRIYKQIGLLSKGHFVEVSRTDLIAGYQGQTALKVNNVIKKAKGGVLFIDEAYSITENDHSDSYGKECLTELTKALEDYRDDLVVIVAGYTEPMDKFFKSNPGLKSRFNTFINFEDYDSKELIEIFINMCELNDYYLSSEALLLVNRIFENCIINKQEQFGNGRFVRNIYEELVMNHSRRVFSINNPNIIDLKEIKTCDVLSINNILQGTNET